MRRPLIASAALAALLVAGVTAAGCARPAGRGVGAAPTASAAGLAAATPGGAAAPVAGGSAANTGSGGAGSAGGERPRPFAVGVRRLNLARGDRTLPTVVWYPARGTSGRPALNGAPVADGRFPVVLYSHGLNGSPEHAQSMTTRMAAAGFVVAAPAYPFTRRGSADFNAGDVPNQPLDGSHVISEVLALDGRTDDPFRGRLRTAKVGAMGHSAGGFTTAGLLGTRRDDRVRAGVVIGGGSLGGFSGDPANLLYIHGDRDPTVTYPIGRAAYDRTPWPKAFLTMLGRAHGDFLGPGANGFDPMMRTVVDFLRWSLYDETAARDRLTADATAPGVTSFESRL